jgi:hypothetical protein
MKKKINMKTYFELRESIQEVEERNDLNATKKRNLVKAIGKKINNGADLTRKGMDDVVRRTTKAAKDKNEGGHKNNERQKSIEDARWKIGSRKAHYATNEGAVNVSSTAPKKPRTPIATHDTSGRQMYAGNTTTAAQKFANLVVKVSNRRDIENSFDRKLVKKDSTVKGKITKQKPVAPTMDKTPRVHR